jgi:phosphopantetheinyl transferase
MQNDKSTAVLVNSAHAQREPSPFCILPSAFCIIQHSAFSIQHSDRQIELLPLPLDERDVEVSLIDLTRLRNPESTAARFLTPEERQQYVRLRHPGRRREWLGARACLKAMLVARGCIGDPLQCQIVKDTGGRPQLAFAPGLPLTAVHDCSLSHKADFACACASSRLRTKVGVDIEKVSPRLLRLAGAFVSDRDKLLGARPPEVRLAVLWSLKEAYTKALGEGLRIALTDVICRETAQGRHRVGMTDGPVCRAKHVLHAGYVIALCLLSEDHKEPHRWQ